MKTLDSILISNYNKTTETLDGRDIYRLMPYMNPDLLRMFSRGVSNVKLKSFTEENIKDELRKDVEYAFRAALSKHDFVSAEMNSVVKMWLDILEDDYKNADNYAYYGLPLLKYVATKYNFPNPIGDKLGNELKFAPDFVIKNEE